MREPTTLMTLQCAAFAAAAGLHSGRFVGGYEHFQAMTAEAVIAVVLGLGLAVAVTAPAAARAAALATQGFALFGTLVGVVMIAIGVGPHSWLDIGIHAFFVALLVTGLVVAARADTRVQQGEPRRPVRS
jgi:ABC-type multidrug transport system permease subunit